MNLIAVASDWPRDIQLLYICSQAIAFAAGLWIAWRMWMNRNL